MNNKVHRDPLGKRRKYVPETQSMVNKSLTTPDQEQDSVAKSYFAMK